MVKLKSVLTCLALTTPLLHAAQLTPVNNAYRYFNRLQKSDNDNSKNSDHNQKGFDDLGWAIHKYDVEKVEKILATGRNPNHQLWTSAQREPFINWVVGRSADLSHINLRSAYATDEIDQYERKNQEIIKLLLKHNANVNVGRVSSCPHEHGPLPPLWEAIRGHRVDLAKMLIDAGALVDMDMLCIAKVQKAEFKKYYDYLEQESPYHFQRMTTLNANMVALLEAAYEQQAKKKLPEKNGIKSKL